MEPRFLSSRIIFDSGFAGGYIEIDTKSSIDGSFRAQFLNRNIYPDESKHVSGFFERGIKTLKTWNPFRGDIINEPYYYADFTAGYVSS